MNEQFKFRVYENDIKIDTIVVNPETDIKIVKKKKLLDHDMTIKVKGDFAQFIRNKFQ